MEHSSKPFAERLAAMLARGAAILIPIVVSLIALSVILYAWIAIAQLFGRLGAGIVMQILAGAASVGMMIGLAGTVYLSRSANIRAVALMFAIGWLPLTVTLVAFGASISSDIVAVPPALANTGRVIAGILAGIAMLPIMVIIMASRRQDVETVREAFGHYLGNLLKVVVLSATSAANIAFGLTRGMPIEVVAFISVVLEIAFMLSLVMARQWNIHAAALVAFGAALAFVSIETVTVLSGMTSLRALASIGEAIYVASPALAIVYIVGIATVGNASLANARALAGIRNAPKPQVVALAKDAESIEPERAGRGAPRKPKSD